MTKKINAANAVVGSIEEAAAIYGVRCYRMQSRVFNVVGIGGRPRPMFVGGWKDRFGTSHKGGMADILLTPKILITPPSHLIHIPMNTPGGVKVEPIAVCVALWVECKSGSGKLNPEQKLFRDDVIEAGAFYIEAHDGPDAVIEWFEKYGVRR